MKGLHLILGFVLVLALNASAQLKVLSDGDVNIPDYKYLWLGSTSTSDALSLRYDGHNSFISYSNSLYFHKGTTNKMYLTSSGKLHIGTSFPYYDYGNPMVNITNSDGPCIWSQSGGNSRGIVSVITHSSATTFVVKNSSSGSDKFYVRHDGLACSASGFYDYSDYKLKKEVKTIDNALKKITQLRGVSYKFKPEYDSGVSPDKRKFGVIAQEVEEIVPEAVETMADSIKAVNYSTLVGVLIEAVKELDAEVNQLKNNGSTKDKSATTTDIKTESETTTDAKLYQNTPNPFTYQTEIAFYLPENITKANIYTFSICRVRL